MDDRTSEDGIGSLTAVLNVTTTTTTGKTVGFRELSLCVRFIICLKKTRTPPPVKQPSRSSSSRSYVAIGVDTEGEEDEGESEKQRLRRIVREKDLRALEEIGGVDGVISLLHSESEDIANDGLELSVPGTGFWDSFFLLSKGFWYYLWLSLNSCTVFFLIIAADLSFAIGLLEQGHKSGWHDGVGTLAAVFLLVFVPSVANFYRKRAEEKKLLKNKKKLEVCVERGGILEKISVSDVKEGEFVHLKKGDRLPADGLLIQGKNLILDEVINPKIDLDQNPFLFSGSVVKHGNGIMIAVSTGADTALGKGLADVTVNPSEETLLQSRMNKPYKCFDKFGLAVSIMIPLVVLIRLLCGRHDDYYNDKPETKGKLTVSLMMNIFERIFLKSGGRVSVLATVLVTIVIGIQHGMPCVISVSFCLWGKKIGLFGGKSQNLLACGTMGLISAICIDITGELSIRKIEVDEFWIGEEEINREMKTETDQAILEVFEPATKVLFLDPMTSVCLTNDLLNSWAISRWKMNIESLNQKFDIIEHKKLNCKKGIGALMSTSGDDGRNLHLHYNGDASTILRMCSQYYDVRGRIHDIENQKDFFEKVIYDMTNKGLRPVGLACKQTNQQEFEEEGLKLLGFVGLKYSCQEIKMAVEDLRRVGVRIILTSEDELSVARAMAYDLGIQCGSNNAVVEGEEIREIMKGAGEEKTENLNLITVLGKAIPEDKLLLIQGLKDSGHVVAFLGGLTSSDAPALREADVGLTQENWSTELSQTVSDLIVVGAGSLTPILRSGRCAYINVQRFFRLQLTASISGLLITLVSTAVSGESPLTIIHLIWATLIMCLLGGLMMAMELNDEAVETPPESNRNQSLVTKAVLKKVAIHVLYQALLLLLFAYQGQKVHLLGMNEQVLQTMVFNTFILCQIFNLFDAMELVKKQGVVLKAVLHRYCFLSSLVGIMVVQVLVIEFAGSIVNCVKLSALQWAICVLFASLTLALEWALNTLSSDFEFIDSHCRFLFFASLTFVFSVSYGSQFSPSWQIPLADSVPADPM